MRFNTLHDRTGQRIGAYQFVYDVTERLRSEERLRAAEDSLRQAQKMEALGQLTSGVFQYIDRIENRRVFAADPVTGLVMGLSHFRHPMDFTAYEVTAQDGTKLSYDRDEEMQFDPFDLPAAHIFKVGADGKVHEIEAMGFQAPLNSPTGWE